MAVIDIDAVRNVWYTSANAAGVARCPHSKFDARCVGSGPDRDSVIIRKEDGSASSGRKAARPGLHWYCFRCGGYGVVGLSGVAATAIGTSHSAGSQSDDIKPDGTRSGSGVPSPDHAWKQVCELGHHDHAAWLPDALDWVLTYVGHVGRIPGLRAVHYGTRLYMPLHDATDKVVAVSGRLIRWGPLSAAPKYRTYRPCPTGVHVPFKQRWTDSPWSGMDVPKGLVLVEDIMSAYVLAGLYGKAAWPMLSTSIPKFQQAEVLRMIQEEYDNKCAVWLDWDSLPVKRAARRLRAWLQFNGVEVMLDKRGDPKRVVTRAS